jgi:hypothetical protein
MKPLLPLLLLFYSLPVFSQKVTAINGRENTKAYIGVKNPIFYTVENYSCKSTYVTAIYGKIEDEGSCYFTYLSNRAGWDSLTVYDKSTKKRISGFAIEVRPIPNPFAKVGGKREGTFYKGQLMAQGGIGADISPSLGFDLPLLVVNFMVMIIRDDSIIFSKSYQGNAFTDDLREGFKLLKDQDKVVFSSIVIKTASGILVPATPLEYSIIDPQSSN